MAIKDVLKMGTPTLYQRSQPVSEFACSHLYDLIQDLKDTMRESDGVGIAAPQIGCNQRVIIFGFEHSDRYPNAKPIPFTVLINPEIEFLSDEKILGWEGCLSVPGLRGQVPRCSKIRYSGFDEEGEKIERVVDNFHARVVQHEYDHINGVLYPQRITNMQQFGYRDVLSESIYSRKSK